jgi:predicted O-methyltransferase YrrM
VTTFDQAWTAVASVDGWMTEGQGRALYGAAERCPSPGRIVEIGSFQGRSTIVLAMGAADGVEIVAIDPHAGNDRGPQEIEGFADEADVDHRRFEYNLRRAGVRDRVTHLRMFSADALAEVDGHVDVLYIDGAHRYRPALADIRQWGDRMSDEGTMLIHDSFSSIGVTGAIVRHLFASSRFEYFGRSRSLAMFRATTLSPRRRVANSARLAAQLPWFVKNVGVKVLISIGVLRDREWPY